MSGPDEAARLFPTEARPYELAMGDCLGLLERVPSKSVDAVICDPPYGIDYQSRHIADKARRKPKIAGDKEPFTSFIPLLGRVVVDAGCVLAFTRWDVQQLTIDAMNGCGLRVRNVLIWDKGIHGMGDLKRAYGSRYESIVFASGDGFRFVGKRPQDVLRSAKVRPKDLLHPNEKPVELLETLIGQVVPEGGVVLDCFMGSGSTGVACMNTGRRFIGIELDQAYFDVARRRIEAAAGEQPRRDGEE